MRVFDPLGSLREAGLRPKRHFGQNFLVSEAVARTIATACIPDGEIGLAHAVEIGAGTGALTGLLCERARHVCAVERDRELIPLLRRQFHACENVTIVEADAKSADLEAMFAGGPPRVLCGNLPYSLTGPLLRVAAKMAGGLTRTVFMVQDEVAARLRAAPGTKDYGAMTVFLRAVYDVQRVVRVGPGAFHPPPEVTSAVVELVPRPSALAIETQTFRAVVHLAFTARRKTLRNAWASLSRNVGQVERAAACAGISLDDRGEVLSVEDFGRMASALDEVVTDDPQHRR